MRYYCTQIISFMKFTLLLLTILSFSSAFAQHNCGALNVANSMQNAARATTGTGQNIDVVYHRIFWRLNPDTLTSNVNPYIRGTVTTYFRTTQNNVSSINFDLVKASYQTGLVVRYHGSSISTFSFPTTGNVDVLNITLPSTITTTGTLDSVTIEYRGVAPAVNGEAYGARKGGDNTGAVPSTSYYYWTLAESYEDKNFLPVKHDMTDKVDSMQITISCPTGHIGVANGKLISEVTTTIGKEFTYKSSYPIASYLIAFSVGRFTKYDRAPVVIGGVNVPITYYRRSTLSAASLTSADANRSLMTVLSSKFGDYPFKNDGYGMMEFGFGGGMEHQSMSSMASSSFTGYGIIAHELAHQWFGDKITFSSWSDLWISEGFTNYAESVGYEFDALTTTNPVSLRAGFKTAALSNDSTTISLPNITNSNTIWTAANNDAIYKKGAMVVSMLRKLLGDDKFFLACQNMLNHPNHAYKSISTAEVKTFFEEVSGLDLTEFFNDWIYAKGNPSYTVDWGNFGNIFNVRLNQTVNPLRATVSHFSMPVVLKIANAAGTQDTTIVIFDNNNIASNAGRLTNQLSYNLSFIPATVTLDPNNDMLVTLVGSGSTVTKNSVLNIDINNFTGTNKTTFNEVSLVIDKNEALQSVILEKGNSYDNYVTVGNLLSSEETNTEIKYKYNDYSPIKPATFYRIKFIYKDGTIHYSNYIKVNVAQTEKLKIINSASVGNELRFVLNSNTLVNAKTINIYATDGKLQKSETIKYNNQGNVNVNAFSSGFYIVVILDKQNNPIATNTFVK